MLFGSNNYESITLEVTILRFTSTLVLMAVNYIGILNETKIISNC